MAWLELKIIEHVACLAGFMRGGSSSTPCRAALPVLAKSHCRTGRIRTSVMLARIADHKISDSAALLPWNWRSAIPVDRCLTVAAPASRHGTHKASSAPLSPGVVVLIRVSGGGGRSDRRGPQTALCPAGFSLGGGSCWRQRSSHGSGFGHRDALMRFALPSTTLAIVSFGSFWWLCRVLLSRKPWI